MPTIDYIDIGDVLNCEYLQGEIVTLDDSDDTCTVRIGGDILSAIVYYHCEPTSALRSNGAIEGGATGFVVGDSVIVHKKKNVESISDIKVIGHVNGARHCASGKEGYFLFYRYAFGQYKMAIGVLDSDIVTVSDKTDIDDLLMTQPSPTMDFEHPVTWQIKKFNHKALTGGATVDREFYCIFTSLYFALAPFPGWTAFASDNPSHPLVTNRQDSEITYSAQVMTDMQTVNAAVNAAHSYVSDPAGNDHWKILGTGESGDCDDFALTKAQELLNLGYPASALHIEASLIKDAGEGVRAGHAWLVVQTTNGNYALDVNSNDVGLNSSLTVSGKSLYTRRRQIGNNWSFISPYSAFLSAVNVQRPYNFVYIFDPLLNLIHRMPYTTGAPPYLYAEGVYYEGTHYGPISINFSDDHEAIYYVNDGNLYTCHVEESEIQATYVSCEKEGFVTKDGQVKPVFPAEPLETTGHPYNSGVESHSSGLVILNNGDMSNVKESGKNSGVYYVGEEVISLSGYYDFKYQYAPVVMDESMTEQNIWTTGQPGEFQPIGG